MKRLSDTRRNRNTALVMLLLWLFAVSSGIANACVLQAHGNDAHLAGVQPSTHLTAAMAGHAETIVDHDGPLDGSRAPCLKVCDDSSQALIKLTAFFDLADRGPALTDSMLWAMALPLVSVQRHMDTPPTATSEPPLRVRYSRIALQPRLDDPCGATPCSPRFLGRALDTAPARGVVPKKTFSSTASKRSLP